MSQSALLPFMPSYSREEFVFSNFESLAKPEILQIEQLEVLLDKQGYIRVYQLFKFRNPFHSPGFSDELSFKIEITDALNYFDLYEHYCVHYEKKAEACARFCNYIKVDRYFHNSLTEMQVMCLLGLYYYGSRKNIAICLKLNEKNIEYHLTKVREKLYQAHLQEVINFLKIEKECKALNTFKKPRVFP